MTNSDSLSVFISYARSDASDFAEYLAVALKLEGFNAYLDRHDIAKAEDWKARLGELITKSDTVIFIITPGSIRSKRCGWEVKRTLKLGKRLVPVQWIGVPEAKIPVELKRLNYTVFASGLPFSGPMGELADTLRQDLGWLRQQTELTERAARWNARKRDPDLLLRGSALADARSWMLRRKPTAPDISPIVNALIGVSEEFEALQKNEARKRLEEREKLVAEAEQLQKAREAALKEAQDANVRAIEEAERADEFVNLVSSDPAGRRAMKKICLEAIEVTAFLATTPDRQESLHAQERFWELYYAQMYIVELHQRRNSAGSSPIEGAMVEFGVDLKSARQSRARLPYSSLRVRAKSVKRECVSYLRKLDNKESL